MANEMTIQDIIAALVGNMNNKGSTSASDLNLLGNDIFGAVTGTYNEQPKLSTEQEKQKYQPTLYALLSSADQGSFESQIAREINDGAPISTVKRNILGLIESGAIPENEEKVLFDVADAIAAEKEKYNEYLLKPKEDAFTRMNLPSADERYDPTQIAPEVFQSMLSRIQSEQSNVNKRISDVNVANPNNNAVSYKPGSKEQIDFYKNQILSEWKKSNKPWQELAPFDPSKDQAQTFGQVSQIGFNEFVNNPVSSALGITGYGRGLGNLFRGVAKDMFNPDSPKEDKKKRDAAATKAAILRSQENPNTSIVEQRSTAMNKAQVDYLRELAGAPAKQLNVGNTGGQVTQIAARNLRDPVSQQQRIMELTAQKISQGMEKSGYTPANIGLIQKLMAAKGLK
jgi:hypothetical protein